MFTVILGKDVVGGAGGDRNDVVFVGCVVGCGDEMVVVACAVIASTGSDRVTRW